MRTSPSRTPPRPRSRILIVDDHPITRYGLIQLIGQENDLEMCGEAEDADRAMGAVRSARPDLVLLDLTLPGKSGLELIKDIKSIYPGLPVLVMSMHDETIYAERALRAGAQGYIMKNEGGARLLEAIRAVLSGEVFFSRQITSSILSAIGGRRKPRAEPGLGVLTDREFDVFQLMGQGFSTKEIAARLRLSSKTVATHRMHMMQKLNAHSGPELLRDAVRWAATQQLV